MIADIAAGAMTWPVTAQQIGVAQGAMRQPQEDTAYQQRYLDFRRVAAVVLECTTARFIATRSVLLVV